MPDARARTAPDGCGKSADRDGGIKGVVFEEPMRFDVLVEECLLLKRKSVQEVLPVHKAQLLSYMKLLDIPVGLLINFHEVRLVNGIHRMILPGANQP
jgi:GxxExxY protein